MLIANHKLIKESKSMRKIFMICLVDISLAFSSAYAVVQDAAIENSNAIKKRGGLLMLNN